MEGSSWEGHNFQTIEFVVPEAEEEKEKELDHVHPL
jgi:hypothetical protein